MRRIRCYECGKIYDYDEDAFCPKCGAFSQPLKAGRISETGEVVLRDGIKEIDHVRSFAHQELHQENRTRRRSGLEGQAARPETNTPPQTQSTEVRKGKAGEFNPAGLIFWIVFCLIAFNLLMSLFRF